MERPRLTPGPFSLGEPRACPCRFRHHVGVTKILLGLSLGLVLQSPVGTAATGEGLYGVVTRGPTKPVCSSGDPCSEPAAHTKLRFMRGSTVTASVLTDARGHYRVRLARGVYVVRVGATPPGGLGSRIAPASVRVRAVWRHQDFDIDTGIR